MLFTWAQAVSYCHKSHSRMIAPKWAGITRIGPWLRGERYKRYYGGDFTPRGCITGLRRLWLLLFRRKEITFFRGMKDFFEPFLADRSVVVEKLFDIVNPSVIANVDHISSQGRYIGVHVRRGDFAQAGYITPDEWYIEAIKKVIASLEGEFCIRVYTDGYPKEVEFIRRAFPNNKVIIMPKAPAIQDVISMSRAEVLVCSPKSTFSMWAVFIGQMPSVWRRGESVPCIYAGEDKSIFV